MRRRTAAGAKCQGRDQRRDFARIGDKPAIGGEKGREPIVGRCKLPAGGRKRDPRRRAVAPIEEHLDTRASLLRRIAKRLAALPFDCRQHAFDMLAGAQPVDTMIDAAAGIGMVHKAADLHFVRAAGAGPHAERAENLRIRLQRLDRHNLGSATPAPQRDLVGVSGLPASLRRRPVEHGPGFRGRSALADCGPRGRHPFHKCESQCWCLARTVGGEPGASIAARPSTRDVPQEVVPAATAPFADMTVKGGRASCEGTCP